jgi:membrane protease YdiL (CAAX protease family)
MAAVGQSRSLRQTIAGHPVAAYLLILYPLSWILNLPALLGKSGLGVLPVDIPFQVGVLLPTILGLTGLAFLVTRIADGKTGARALRRHYFRFRVGLQWYLLALLGAPILMLLVSLGFHGGTALSPFGKQGSEIFTAYLLNLVTIAVLISLCEEGGWMAFVTSRLQQRWGAGASQPGRGSALRLHSLSVAVRRGRRDRGQGDPRAPWSRCPSAAVPEFGTGPDTGDLGVQLDGWQPAYRGVDACVH